MKSGDDGLNEHVLSHDLARFLHAASFDDLPEPIVAKALDHALDTLGVMLAGSRAEETRLATQAMLATDGTGAVPLCGQSASLSPRGAALVNGIAAHAYELDDTGGCDHSGAVVWPAIISALAMADRPVDGREVLLAMVLGYDVGRRVLIGFGGYVPHNNSGWHSTATCGPFAAMAAAARIMGLDGERIQAGLGLAGSFAGGTWAFIHDGSMSKRVHAGRAAEGGLLAAILAQHGMSGPAHIFSDRWGGFFGTLGKGRTPDDAFLRDLGTRWLIEDAAIKPHASCRDVHAAIDAVARIQSRSGIIAEDIASLEARLSPFLIGMVGGRDITTMAAAQMSLPYGIAARLRFGAAGLRQYGSECRSDETVRRLLAAVEIVADDNVGASWDASVTVTMKDGARFEEPTTIPLGAPSNPLSSADIRGKFDTLTDEILTASQASELAQMIAELPRMGDARTLLSALSSHMRQV